MNTPTFAESLLITQLLTLEILFITEAVIIATNEVEEARFIAVVEATDCSVDVARTYATVDVEDIHDCVDEESESSCALKSDTCTARLAIDVVAVAKFVT